jgi:3-oxo-5alpha-steroid 4-dehydrogenase
MTAYEQIGPEHPDWLSPVEAPLEVSNAEALAWDIAAELVIVGYGGAGVAAALEAAENGVDVLAIDRYDGGGSTAMNGGIYYAGGGTSIQKAAGYSDSPEEMYKYLRIETAGIVKDETLRRFCEGSVASVEWLLERGVKLNSRIFLKKWGYPDPRYFLYYSDNSLAPSRGAHARAAPRGHRMFGPKLADGRYGKFLYQPLREAASRAGVRLLPQTEVRQLVVDKSGRVIGVKALLIPPNTPAWRERQYHQRRANEWQVLLPPTFPGARYTYRLAEQHLAKVMKLEAEHRVSMFIRATAGVCLSAGGFIYNRAMIHRYAPHHDATAPMGNPGDDGSGIRLGQSVGGVADRMGHLSSWRFLNPPSDWVKGMIVNRHAERFVDESLYGASVGHALNEEQGGIGFLIFDRDINRSAWRELFTVKMMGYQRYPGILSMWKKPKADSIEALAVKIGLEPAKLAEAVAAYNRVAAGVDRDPFGKDQKEIRPILNGPFYAVDISASNTLIPMMAMTLGGLIVDERTGQVMRANARDAIPGLYAAGRAAIGICSNIYMSGLSAADCIFSGRRAGGHIAAALQAKKAQPTAIDARAESKV